MAGMDWFRWHHGTVTDPKFQLIARKASSSVAEVVAVWAVILEEASMCEARGALGQFDFESIDCALGMDDGKAKAIHDLMAERGLLDLENGVVAKWNKRQPKREDDTAAERKRQQREREKALEKQRDAVRDCVTNEHVTQCHARGEESRQEVNQSISASTGGGDFSLTPPATPSVAASKASKGSRLPDDWQLPKPWGDWALSERSGWTTDDVRRIAEKFADHWRAQPGAKGRKADWQATWRNWVRNESHGPPARASPWRAAAAEDRERVSEILTGRGSQHGSERDITGEAVRLA